MSSKEFQSIPEAIKTLQRGGMIILVDDEKRENEGDLVMAADFVNAEAINFMTQHARGLVCMPMHADHFTRLNIPLMVKHNHSHHKTAFGVSIGASSGITTGISAADRAATIAAAANPNHGPDAIVMPGHVFPLLAEQGGVLSRQGHTEGSVDLMKLAGLNTIAVICEVMNTDGTMARLPQLCEFAKQHEIPIVSIQDIVTYRIQNENLIEEISAALLPVRDLGRFQIKIFKNAINTIEHIALVKGPIDRDQPCLLRIHSECMTGDVFGSSRCDCGHQLAHSLELISRQGGVLLYLRQEGRGIGLANKIKAYALQENGLDTVEANEHLGFEPDARDYGFAAQILRELSIEQVKLLTNNPHKVANLQRYGVNVRERISIEIEPNSENISYLRTKRDKLGHWLSRVEEV